MDESTYHKVIADTFRAIEDALEDVDPDVVEISNTGDVLTLSFQNGVRCVLNTQRPVRQLWMAARDTAWHFDYDEGTKRWMDDRGRGIDLGRALGKVIHEMSGHHVAFAEVG